MYHWEHWPHLGENAGIGEWFGEPYQFDSEEEYRQWYFDKLHRWLVWA